LVTFGGASARERVRQAFVDVDAAGLPCALEARRARVALVSADKVYAQSARLAVASRSLPRAFVDILTSVRALRDVVVGWAGSTQRAEVGVVTPLHHVTAISHEGTRDIKDLAAAAVVHSAEVLNA
jgi:hypothetical protein